MYVTLVILSLIVSHLYDFQSPFQIRQSQSYKINITKTLWPCDDNKSVFHVCWAVVAHNAVFVDFIIRNNCIDLLL